MLPDLASRIQKRVIAIAIALMLDQDDAGRKASQEILSCLARMVFVRVIELPFEGDQPDGMEEQDLVRIPQEILKRVKKAAP